MTIVILQTIPYEYAFVKPEEVQEGWLVEVKLTVKSSPTELVDCKHWA